jgi:hypothetical protein
VLNVVAVAYSAESVVTVHCSLWLYGPLPDVCVMHVPLAVSPQYAEPEVMYQS